MRTKIDGDRGLYNYFNRCATATTTTTTKEQKDCTHIT